MSPYKIVDEFEKCVAEYAGAKYGVAVNSCSNALMMSIKLRQMQGIHEDVILPKYTYVGVGYAALNVGEKCRFIDLDWQGAYTIPSHNIVDSARRFKRGMYSGGLYCLSFHWLKHLPIGRGGMILTDSKIEADILKRIRFDGRTAGVPPKKDTFDTPGYHVYMIPEDAARGLMLMSGAKDSYPDIPWDDYADLSKHKIFTNGY